MTREDKNKIIKALEVERNYYAKECERRIATEQGKIVGADYTIQRLLDVLDVLEGTEVESLKSEEEE